MAVEGIIGKKVGMTQVFTAEGNAVPVTVIDVTSCEVVGKRTMEKDQYTAVVIGLVDAKEKHLTKAQIGSFKKAGAIARTGQSDTSNPSASACCNNRSLHSIRQGVHHAPSG